MEILLLINFVCPRTGILASRRNFKTSKEARSKRQNHVHIAQIGSHQRSSGGVTFELKATCGNERTIQREMLPPYAGEWTE